MTAIISRSQESATQATPAARERKQNRLAVAVASPTTRQQDRAWLTDLEKALNAAANADCPHIHSGESDRLLRVAYEISARLAGTSDAALDGPAGNELFTVAALVKAALQVPGDVASPERLAFIEQARVPLVGLTDCATVLDGWDTYPSAMPSAGPSAGAESEKRYHLSGDQHNSIYMRLDHAEAALSVLVHVFSGDANTEDPMTAPGLKGTLQHIQWLTRGLHSELSVLASKLPPGLVERVTEANAMIDLMEHLESNGGFQFNRWSDALTCSYLSAIEHSVKAAMDLLDEVGVGNA